MEKVVCSIVIYKSNENVLRQTLKSVLETELSLKIYLIDNSPTDHLRCIVEDEKIEYIFNPSNPGFGASHNIALKKSVAKGVRFHFIINPDVSFSKETMITMINFMKSDLSVGMIMPKILNIDGSIQNLPKLLPSPLHILIRKFKYPKQIYQNMMDKYEMRFIDDNDILVDIPILSGCFTLINTNAIIDVGMYDENFFMYFEDWDLSRRINAKYRTLYFPKVSVNHKYESGANKSPKLFFAFLSSMIKYFNKWGWIFDEKRKHINHLTLKDINR